jgi:hypothetical protein
MIKYTELSRLLPWWEQIDKRVFDKRTGRFVGDIKVIRMQGEKKYRLHF